MKSPAIHQTPLYRAKAAYRNMLRRCENKCGTEPAYARVKLKMTMAEWLAWSVPRYEKFLEENPGVRPSVSRKSDKGHYQIGNVEIVAFGVNRNAMAMPGQAKNGKKRCARCKESKPVSEFNKKVSSRDGYGQHCKPCHRIYQQQYSSKPEVKAARREKRRVDTALHFN